MYVKVLNSRRSSVAVNRGMNCTHNVFTLYVQGHGIMLLTYACYCMSVDVYVVCVVRSYAMAGVHNCWVQYGSLKILKPPF